MRVLPCHPGADPETFSCLFCCCPLYALGDRPRGRLSFHCTRQRHQGLRIPLRLRPSRSGKLQQNPGKKCRRFWSWRRKMGRRPDWECLHVPGDLCWDRLQKRPNWPLPAGANSYTFADGEGGGICPRFLARKRRFATDPFSFYGLTWCVDLLLYCLLFLLLITAEYVRKNRNHSLCVSAYTAGE
ncbi:MAG: cysteine-rich small domain-containing protein [Oscillospiraceae bacterium]